MRSAAHRDHGRELQNFDQMLEANRRHPLTPEQVRLVPGLRNVAYGQIVSPISCRTQKSTQNVNGDNST
jgi:hypothetical protein